MAKWYDQLHNVSNNPTKLEQNPSSGYRVVAFTNFGRCTDAKMDIIKI